MHRTSYWKTEGVDIYEQFVDQLAVATEHRDITKAQAMRERFVALLEDNGRQYPWTAEPSKRAWLEQAIATIDDLDE